MKYVIGMKSDTAAPNAIAAIFDSNIQAEESIESLRRSGVDMKRLSLVGKDRRRGAYVVGCYSTGDQVRYCGHADAFWSRCWARFAGWAFLFIPGMGPVQIAGPFGGWVVSAIENAPVFGGLSPLGAGLYSLGISRDAVLRYESAVNAGGYLLIVHGAADEVAIAREILFGGANTARDGA